MRRKTRRVSRQVPFEQGVRGGQLQYRHVTRMSTGEEGRHMGWMVSSVCLEAALDQWMASDASEELPQTAADA